MKLERMQLRKLIYEIVKEQMVPMRLRGQGNREAFASGIFEEDTEEDLDEQELPMGYGTPKERERRRLAGIEGDESAFGE